MMMTPVFVILIPITLIFIVVIAFVFYRALHGGQFDRLDSISEEFLADDDRNPQLPSDRAEQNHYNPAPSAHHPPSKKD